MQIKGIVPEGTGGQTANQLLPNTVKERVQDLDLQPEAGAAMEALQDDKRDGHLTDSSLTQTSATRTTVRAGHPVSSPSDVLLSCPYIRDH